MQTFVPVEVPTIPESNTSNIGTLAVNTIDFGFKKSEKSDGAFGTLDTVGTAQNGARSEVASKNTSVSSVAPTRMMPRPQAGSSGVSDAGGAEGFAPQDPSSPQPVMPISGTSVAISNKMIAEDTRIMMPPFQQKVYNYIYTGSGFTVEDAQMSVLQKKKNSMTNEEAQSFLRNFKISTINLANFSSLKLNNMTLLEDREYGLGINIDFFEGTLGISKNWNKWPQMSCDENGCPITKLEDVLSDEKAVSIADKFFRDFGISVAAYGKPQVNNDWRKEYERAADKSTAWIPDTVTVVYPLVIEGKTVYEEYGQEKGITVSIDVKTGRVSDAYGMEKLDFDSSRYATETDVAKILEVAKNGGRTWNYGGGIMPRGENEPAPMVVDVRLGEPEMNYVHLADYERGESKQYLVPALVFPVLDTPKEGEYFQDTIIVPVIQEFFTRKNSPIMYMKEVQ